MLLSTIDFDTYTDKTTLTLDIAMIRFVVEFESIKYYVCTVLVSCTVMYSFSIKKVRIYIIGKKRKWPIKSTSCYLVPFRSYEIQYAHMNTKKDGNFIGVDLYVGYMISQGFPIWVHLLI